MDGNVSGCLKEHPVVSTRSPVGHFAALFAFNIVTIIPLHLLMWKVAIKYTTWTWCATLVQMSTLDVIANILSWWLIESIRVFNFSVWFGHFGARRSSSNRNHQMIFRAQMITEKLRQSLKPETDPESELLPRGDKDCWKTERSLFCSLDFPGCDQRQFSRLSLTPNSSFSVLYSQFEVVW